MAPAARASNPHLRYQPQQPLPAPLPQQQVTIQQNQGFFPHHIITNTSLRRDIVSSQWDTFMGSNRRKFVLVIANGGNHVFDVRFDVPLADQIRGALRVVARNGDIFVHYPIKDPEPKTNGKYGGPFVMLVEVADDADANAILAQRTFAVNNALAFWAHDIDANHQTRNWCFAYYRMEHPGGQLAEVLGLARGGLIHAAYTTAEIFHLIDQITQGHGGDPRARVFAVLNTIHFDLVKRDETWIVVGYMQPPTDNELVLANLYALFRPLKFYAGMYGFLSMTNGRPADCVLCKAPDHPSFMCPYSDPELVWWGPPAQLKDLPHTNPLMAGARTSGNAGAGGNQQAGSSARGEGFGGRGGRFARGRGRRGRRW